MVISEVANSGTIPVLEKMLAFTEARHRMLAENIANIDNPNYRAKQLDTAAFQRALRKAVTDRRECGSTGFSLPAAEQFHQDASGRLVVQPGEEPPENVLFHDQTNARVERQMAMLAENTMMHQAATELLRGQFESLLKAIRGRPA